MDQKRDPASVNADFVSAALDNAGVGVYETAVSGEILFINLTLAEMLGFESIDAFMQADQNVHGWYADPDTPRRFRSLINEYGTVKGFITQVKRKDGTLFWASEHANPLYDDDGNLTSFIGSLADVSELVETQNRLAEAERSYKRIFERVNEGVYRSSLEGRQLRANPALWRLNGYSSEEEQIEAVKDIAIEWYVDPNRRDEFVRQLEENDSIENFESEIYRHKTRERIWISENAYLVRDKEGEPLFFEGTVRDVTERKETEIAMVEALRQAQSAKRAKTRFLAHMSHELRTPLNAVLGFSDLIRHADATRTPIEKIVEYAQDIYNSGSHLLDLINDILDLSRIENDALTLDVESVSIEAAVVQACNPMRPIADNKKISILIGDLTPGFIRVDRRAVHQCLLNVLSNAIKFTESGGAVSIDVRDRDAEGLVEIAIHDNGCGIPQSLLTRIGEPFINATEGNASTGTGAGLGLAITRSLIERMGGRFEVESVVGRGTRVALFFPKVVGERADQQPSLL